MDYQISSIVNYPIPFVNHLLHASPLPCEFRQVDSDESGGIGCEIVPSTEKPMTFAERLKIARARAKISQESLAHKVGITKASVSKFELGLTANPAMDTLFKMADILQVDPRWLATGRSELSPRDDGPVLRFDANRALATLPTELREPILQMIESASKASEQRYWNWAKEKDG